MWSINVLLFLLVSIVSYTADLENLSGSLILEESHYGTLGVPLNADLNTIKKAYRKKALLTHPDKHPNDPHATQKFQAIQNSFELLSDPKERDQYNEELIIELCNSRDKREQKRGQQLSQSIQEKKVSELLDSIYSFFNMFSDCRR